MKTTCLQALLVAGCLGLASLTAQGQTARIAHFSHGGSVATLAELEAADNFGLPPTRFIADTIVATSDTTAVAYGRTSRWGDDQKAVRNTRTINYGKYAYQQAAATGPQSRGMAVRLLQQRYPKATLVGFDTLAKPAALPLNKQKKRKRKAQEGAVFLLTPPAEPPQHLGVWLALATIIGLGAAGLLLHDKPLPAFKAAA